MVKSVIREANNDDIPEIARLRTNIIEFSPIKADEFILFWNWFINDNPCAFKKALVAVNDRNRVIAHFAMVPFKFLKDRELLLAGSMCQLMVDENYRNEFLFPKMMLEMLNEYQNLGINFLYGLANKSYITKAYLSFGFREIGVLRVYVRPYKLTRIADNYIKNRLLNAIIKPGLSIADKVLRLRRVSVNKGLKVTEIYRFDSSIDKLLTKVQRHFPYRTVRDYSILNWRFVDSPIGNYQILVIKEEGNIIGYTVLSPRKMKQFNVLAIVDILFSPERTDVGKALLQAIHKIAVESNVDMSACLFNPHDPLCPILKKCGYLKTPESFSLIVHEPKGTTPQFREDSFYKWHLTWFDHDSG